MPSVRKWLHEIEDSIPAALGTAKFWICHARLVELEGNHRRAVHLFEEAVRHDAKVQYV